MVDEGAGRNRPVRTLCYAAPPPARWWQGWGLPSLALGAASGPAIGTVLYWAKLTAAAEVLGAYALQLAVVVAGIAVVKSLQGSQSPGARLALAGVIFSAFWLVAGPVVVFVIVLATTD